MKLDYNFKGIPITPGARNVYRPGRWRGGPLSLLGKIALVLVVLFIVAGAVFLFRNFNDEPGIVVTPAPESVESTVAALENTPLSEPEELPRTEPREPVAYVAEVVPVTTLKSGNEKQFAKHKEILRLNRIGDYKNALVKINEQLNSIGVDPANVFFTPTQDALAVTADKLRQSGAFSAGETEYVVQKGDYLSTISRKTKTSVAVIKKRNNLQNDTIFPNQKLFIPKSSWNITIYAGAKKMYLYDGKVVIKIYNLKPVSGAEKTRSFKISENGNTEQWNKFGLSRKDQADVLKFVPVDTPVKIETK